MEFASFTTLVREEVEKRAGENCRVRLNDVRKNNGIVLSGITVMQDESNISPTIYLNNYYEDYENGNITIVNVVNDVMDTYNKNRVNKNVDMRYFLDFENVRDKLVYKLVNTEKNRELLEDVPHVEFLDLSIVFQCLVSSEENSTASILVHNAHSKLWEVSTMELYKAARDNTQKLMGYEVKSMDDIITEMMLNNEVEDWGDDGMKALSSGTPMYVLTNKTRIDGAACIVYPDLLDDFAYSIGSSFYVIPSSVHEVILVPAQGMDEAGELKRMIREVNDTQVKVEEILSYSLYYFDKDESKLLKI